MSSLNNRSYSYKVTRACATIPTTKSPKRFLADVRLLNISSGRPQGVPKSYIRYFQSYSLVRAAQCGFFNERLSSLRSVVRANKQI